MKKPKKRDALKAACLQAAAAVWATGKLHPHYGANTPQQHADGLADFALLLYRAWVKKDSAPIADTAATNPDDFRPRAPDMPPTSTDRDAAMSSAAGIVEPPKV
jgi:hypothetical protein